MDIKEGSVTTSSGNQSLLEKPKTLKIKKGERPPSQNYQSTVFNSVVNLAGHGQLLRFANIEQPSNLAKSVRRRIRQQNQWVGLYNHDMELLAEGVKPKWFESSGPTPTFINGKILSIKRNEEGGNQITFYKSKVRTKDSVEVSELKERLFDFEYTVSPPLSEYYSSFAIPKGATILLVPRFGCPSCRERSISYFLDNLEQMEQQNVYLVVAVRNKEEIEQLERTDSPHVIVDDKQKVEDYLNTGVTNPALMQWNGEKVTRQLILNPQQAREIELYVEEFARI